MSAFPDRYEKPVEQPTTGEGRPVRVIDLSAENAKDRLLTLAKMLDSR